MATIEAQVASLLDDGRRTTLSFHLDSGVSYTVIPARELEDIGIRPSGARTFCLADGQPVSRRIGEARITFRGETATCVVMFGEEGDSTLLGVTTLENLGLIFDPIRQKIMTLPMMLAEARKLFAS